MDGDGCVAWIFVLGLAACVIGAGFKGCSEGREAEQKAAQAAHVARWTVNPETGETEFVYGCEHEPEEPPAPRAGCPGPFGTIGMPGACPNGNGFEPLKGWHWIHECKPDCPWWSPAQEGTKR